MRISKVGADKIPGLRQVTQFNVTQPIVDREDSLQLFQGTTAARFGVVVQRGPNAFGKLY